MYLGTALSDAITNKESISDALKRAKKQTTTLMRKKDIIQKMTVFKKNTVLFIYPTILFLSLGLVIPLFFLFVTSFTNLELGFSQPNFSFVGFSNYVSLLTDHATFKSLSVTLSFVVLAVLIETFLGLCFALGMTASFKGQFIIKALLIVPMMIAPLVVGLVWRYLFDTRFGIINILLEYVGLANRYGLQINRGLLFLF